MWDEPHKDNRVTTELKWKRILLYRMHYVLLYWVLSRMEFPLPSESAREIHNVSVLNVNKLTLSPSLDDGEDIYETLPTVSHCNP